MVTLKETDFMTAKTIEEEISDLFGDKKKKDSAETDTDSEE